MTATYSELPNKLISAANGIDYAYRDAGQGAVPLVLLQHFRGNLDRQLRPGENYPRARRKLGASTDAWSPPGSPFSAYGSTRARSKP
jgi:hypothetical protein